MSILLTHKDFSKSLWFLSFQVISVHISIILESDILFYVRFLALNMAGYRIWQCLATTLPTTKPIYVLQPQIQEAMQQTDMKHQRHDCPPYTCTCKNGSALLHRNRTSLA